MPTFRVALVANSIQWPSLTDKVAQIQAFFAPVCNLIITIEYTNLRPVFNSTYPTLAPVSVVDFDWYDANVSGPRAADADIIIFVVAPTDHTGTTTYRGVMTQHNMGPWETTVFALEENDNVYVNGVDFGNSFVHYACHELSHVFYTMLGKRDDTHVHFPNGQANYTDQPQYVIKDFTFSQQSYLGIKLTYFSQLLTNALATLNLIQKQRVTTIADSQTSPDNHATLPSMPAEQLKTPVAPPNPDYLIPDWSTTVAAHHNVRALCDLEGLTHEQKQVLAACVYVESGFHINAENTNHDGQGKVLSRDWGIVQVNDYWHIGPNKDFPSSEYVLSHPEECVRWMCHYYKQHGDLGAWCSFTSGAYKQWLGRV